MRAIRLYIFLFSVLTCQHFFAQQKIGLVLSGGGATGIAHVGVLKALEENNIPIDFITGTSAGALVGSLYAAGYSPEEIEAFVLSEEFQLMATGKLKPNQHFLLREDNKNARLFGVSVSQESILKKSLPTNFNSSSYLDFEMMKRLSIVSSVVGNNFDSLFVPFRCVASDIAHKKSVVFKNGNLNAAVRASMSYPFYLKPIRINDVLLFDGGLYNNFPADVMYYDFNPDYIIGSNVSYNADLPEEDDIISQLTNMLVSYSDYDLPCEEGIMIEPNSDVSTFDFGDVKEAIDAGYNSTLAQIDSLKLFISHERTKEEVQQRRAAFNAKRIPLHISSVTIHSKKPKLKYLKKSLIKERKEEVLSLEKLEKRYFRLYAMEHIDFMYPNLEMKPDSTFHLDMTVNKSNEFRLNIGGHFSSRPINTGYIGLSYKTVGKIITKSEVESYFGKFYGSFKGKFTLEVPAIYPIATSAYFVMNRWDYFRSFATFFEEVKPSFLVQNEMYAGGQIKHPLSNTVKSTIDAHWFSLEDTYYQTEKFVNTDTADMTNFEGISSSWAITKNSLNRIQFASSGHYFRFKFRHIYGREHSLSGSTSAEPYDIIKYHSWLNLSVDYQSFMVDNSVFHLGFHGQFVYNSRPLFANYTATLLSMSEFSLLPDAATYFLPEYRAPQFVGGGLNTIFTLQKNIDFRIDAYLYQPIVKITENEDGTMEFSKPFTGGTYMASTSLIYHSFIGPVRLTLNYFPLQKNPIALQFSLGYVLFNDRAIR